MAEIHAATGNALTRALVDTVADFITAHRDHAESQASSIGRDKQGAARYAINDVLEELRDHLQIDLAVTLATFGIGIETDDDD